MGIEAKLFMNGGSQAVRIPKDYRFSGKKVLIEKTEAGLLIKPAIEDEWAWVEELAKLGGFSDDFMAEGREQPDMPPMDPDVAKFFGVED
jgi:antitoxin VapB